VFSLVLLTSASISTGLLYFTLHTHLLSLQLFDFLVLSSCPLYLCRWGKTYGFFVFNRTHFFTLLRGIYASKRHRCFRASFKLAGCNSRILIRNWGVSRLFRKQSRPTSTGILPVSPGNPKANSRLMSKHNDCVLSPFLHFLAYTWAR